MTVIPTLTLISIALAAAAPAFAQTQAPVGPLPRAFAGYAQPAIPLTACKAVSPAEAQCEVPAMTAGRYLIEAAGTSSAPAVGANQALQIEVAGRPCGLGRNSAGWKTGSRTFRLDCEVTLLTDTPVAVKVIYADAQATKDPKGPVVTIRPLPWTGVLAAQAFAPKQ
jgi:hypothetical protein